MAKLRIEYVRLDPRGQVAEVLGDGETLDVSAVSAASAAAPDFGAVGGVTTPVGARLTALDSSVIVAIGADPVATAADGLRVTPGRPEVFQIAAGHRVAAIVAAAAAGLPTQSSIITLSATITRPDNATAAVAGDLMPGVFEFDFGAAGLPKGIIISARLVRQRATTSAERFRAYIMDDAPAQATLTDNTPFPQAWADAEAVCGIVDFTSPIATVVADSGASLHYEGVRLGSEPIAFGNNGLLRVPLITLDGFTPTALSGWTLRLAAGA
jgi:hypothetical protein